MEAVSNVNASVAQVNWKRIVLCIVAGVIALAMIAAIVILAIEVHDQNVWSDKWILFYNKTDLDGYGRYKILYEPDMKESDFYSLAESVEYDVVIFTEEQVHKLKESTPDLNVYDLAGTMQLVVVLYDDYTTYQDAALDELGALNLKEESDEDWNGAQFYYVGIGYDHNDISVSFDGECSVNKTAVDAGLQNAHIKAQICNHWNFAMSNGKTVDN